MSAVLKQAGSWAVNKFLSDLLEGVTPDTFTIDFGAGEFGVKDVQINLKHLQGIETPLEIKHVSLGDVRLTIPALWKLLKSPIKVKAEKLYVVGGPTNQSRFTIDERKAMMKATKKLALFVMGMIDGVPQPEEYVDKEAALKSKKKLMEPELFGLPAIVKKLIPVVDNVQVEIANIHIRYEDAITKPNAPFAVGVCLDNLAIRGSTTAEGVDTFVTAWNMDNFRKVCLNSFSLYIDTEGKGAASLANSNCTPAPSNGSADSASKSEKLAPIPSATIKSEMQQLIYKGPAASASSLVDSERQFLLQPMSVGANLQWHRGYDVKVPMIQADANVPLLGVTVSHAQYTRVLDTVAYFNNYNARLKYGYLAPPQESALVNPRAWWQYTIDCVRRRVRHKVKKFRPERISQRIADRDRYINTLREMQHLGAGWVSEADKKELPEIEKRLKYRDVLLFRKMAKLSVLRDTKTGRIPAFGFVDKAPAALKIGAVVGVAVLLWLIALLFLDFKLAVALVVVLISAALGAGYKKIFAKPTMLPFDQSPENFAWMYEQLGLGVSVPAPKAAPQSVFPAEYSLVKFKAEVPRVQLDVNMDAKRPFESSALTLAVEGIRAAGSIGEPTIAVKASVDTISALERITLQETAASGNTALPGQPLHLISHIFPSSDAQEHNSERFVNLDLALKPTDRDVDLAVVVTTTTFNVNASIPFVNAMMGFFIPPRNKAEIKELTSAGMHRMAVAGADQVKAAIRDRQCIALDIRVAGPTVVIAKCYKPGETSDALFVNVGDVLVNSNPKRVANSEQWSEADAYDLYQVEAGDVSISLAKGVWHDQNTAKALKTAIFSRNKKPKVPVIEDEVEVVEEVKPIEESKAIDTVEAVEEVKSGIDTVPASASAESATEDENKAPEPLLAEKEESAPQEGAKPEQAVVAASPNFEEHFVIKPISVSLKAFVCIAGNVPSLPATKLNGDVSSIDVCISPARIHSLWDICLAQFPPSSKKKKTQQSSTVPAKQKAPAMFHDSSALKKAKKTIEQSLLAVHDAAAPSSSSDVALPPADASSAHDLSKSLELIQEEKVYAPTSDIEDESGQERYETLKKTLPPHRSVLVASFAVKSLSVNLLKDGEKQESMAVVAVGAVSADVDVSPYLISVGAKVNFVHMEDFVDDSFKLASSSKNKGIEQKREPSYIFRSAHDEFGAVSAGIKVVPKDSPIYANTLTDILVNLGHVELNVARPVLLHIMKHAIAIVPPNFTIPAFGVAPVMPNIVLPEIKKEEEVVVAPEAVIAAGPIIVEPLLVPPALAESPALSALPVEAAAVDPLPTSSQLAEVVTEPSTVAEPTAVAATTSEEKPAEQALAPVETTSESIPPTDLKTPEDVHVPEESATTESKVSTTTVPVPAPEEEQEPPFILEPIPVSAVHTATASSSGVFAVPPLASSSEKDVEVSKDTATSPSSSSSTISSTPSPRLPLNAAQTLNKSTELASPREEDISAHALVPAANANQEVPASPAPADVDEFDATPILMQRENEATRGVAVRANIPGVRVNLLQEKTNILVLAVSNIAAAVDVRGDGKLGVQGYVGQFNISVLHQGIGEVTMLALDADVAKLVDFKFGICPSIATDYQGHDMSVDAKVGMLKVTYYHLAVMGLVGWALNMVEVLLPSLEDLKRKLTPPVPASEVRKSRRITRRSMSSSTGQPSAAVDSPVTKSESRKLKKSLSQKKPAEVSDEEEHSAVEPKRSKKHTPKKSSDAVTSEEDSSVVAAASSTATSSVEEKPKRKKISRTVSQAHESAEEEASTDEDAPASPRSGDIAPPPASDTIVERKKKTKRRSKAPTATEMAAVSKAVEEEEAFVSPVAVNTPEKPKRAKSLRRNESIKKTKKKKAAPSATPAASAPPKIKISATVASPVVVVPVDPLNLSTGGCLIINVGDVEVANEINSATEIVVDTLIANVSHLNIVFKMPSAAESSSATVSQLTLMDHTGVKASVHRVLAGDEEEHTLPAIGVDVEMLPIHLTFGTPQLDVVFQLLTKHILQPIPKEYELMEYFTMPTEHDKQAALFESRYSAALATQEKVAKWKAAHGDAPMDPLSPALGTWNNIRVTARIASFALDMCDAQFSPQLRLGVKQIGALVAIKNDGYIAVEASLEAVEVVDLIISFDHFNTMFGKPANVIDPMVQVAFVLNPNANAMGVKAGINAPLVTVLPDTILRMKQTWEAPVMAGLKSMNQVSAAAQASSAPPPAAASASNAPQIPNVAPTIKCSVLINSPMVAIIPSVNVPVSTGFTVNLGEIAVNVDLNLAANEITVGAGITKLRLIRSLISAGTLMSINEQYLLHPMELKSSVSIINSNILVNALIPLTQFIASFNDVDLVMKILNAYKPLLDAFAAPPAVDANKAALSKSQVTSAAADSEALLSQHKSSPTSTSAVTTTVDSSAVVAAAAPQSTIAVTMEISAIDIAVIDDRFKNDFFVPLLRFCLSPLKGNFTKEANMAAAFSFSGIEANVYNRDYSGWEPILEPWEMKFGFTQDAKGMSASLVAESILELNVNQSLLVSVFELLEIVAPPKSKKRKSIQLPSADPLVIKNWTGMKCTVQLEDGSEPFVVGLGESRPLNMKRQTRAEAVASPPKYVFSLLVEGATAPARLTTNRVDTIIVPYKVEDPTSIYVLEVSSIKGSRTITVRGSYKVINNTGTPMELMLVADDKSAISTQAETITTDAAGTTITVDPNGGVFSASIAHSASRCLKVRAQGYGWSDVIRFAQPQPAYILKCAELPQEGKAAAGFDWYGTARVDIGKDGEDYTLVIAPPVNVENLCTVPMQVKFVNLKREKEQAKAAEKEKKAAEKEKKAAERAAEKAAKTSLDASSTDAATSVHNAEASSSAPVLAGDSMQNLNAMPTWDIVECDHEDIHSLPSYDETLAISVKLPEFGWSKPTPFVNKIDIKRTDKFESDLVISKTIEVPDENGTMLKVGIDIAITDTAARHIKIYSTSWIVNDTGLPLFFKKDKEDSKIAAGQSRMLGYAIRTMGDPHSKKAEKAAEKAEKEKADKLGTYFAASIPQQPGQQQPGGPLKSLLENNDQHLWYSKSAEELIEVAPDSSANLNAAKQSAEVTAALLLSESTSSAPSTRSGAVSPLSHSSQFEDASTAASSANAGQHEKRVSVSKGYGPYFYYGEKRISISLENSDWSPSNDLGVGDEGTIDIEDHVTGRLYSFFISVRPAPARFWRTSIVRIYPRFVLNNSTTQPLIFRQIHESHTSPTALRLEPGQQLPYHWPSYKKNQVMAAHIADAPHMCTAYFGLDQVGRFPLRFHDTSVALPLNKNGKKTVGGVLPIPSLLDESSFTFAGLNITNVGDSSIFVRFLPDSPDEYFSVHNQSGIDIVVREAQPDPALALLKKQKKEAALAATTEDLQDESEAPSAAPSSNGEGDASTHAPEADTATAQKSEKELAKEKKAAEKAAKEAAEKAEKEKKAADKAADKAAKEAAEAEKKKKKEAEKLAAKEAKDGHNKDEHAAESSDAANNAEAAPSAAPQTSNSTPSKKKSKNDEPPIQVDEEEAEVRGGQGYVLKAKRKEAFMFPSPQNPKHKIQFQLPGDTTWHTVNLDKIHVLPSIKLGDKKYLHMRTVAVGQSKQLIVKIAAKQEKTDEEQLAAAEGSKMSFELSMAGMGVSIIDQTPQELMYLRLGDLKVNASMSTLEQSLEVKLGMIQIDNDLYLTPQPIIAHSLDQPEGDPFFHLALVRDMRYQKFFCFRYFSMKMHKLATRLDMAFALNAMLWALKLTKWIGTRTSGEVEHAVILGEGEGKIKTPVVSATSNGFYFEVFHLNPMAFQISFTPSSNFDCPNLDDAGAEMIAKISPHLITIDEAPLFLGGLLMTNCFTSQEEFIARITAHYVKSVLKQLLMLVGSSDALGNPVSLVNSLGTGVYDLVHEPAAGATQSPAQFGIGIAKGTGSLLKNSLGGVLATAEKLVGNVSKLGEKLSMDKEYQQEREKMKLKKAHHIGTGLTYGFKELGTGIFQGVAGLVTQPVKGAKSKGLKGFAAGLGKGLVGVVVKPTVGVVDLVTRTTEGLRNTGSEHKTVPRVRDPRYIGPDLLIPCYDAEKSEGQLFLRTLADGKYRKEFYAWHKAPSSKTMLLITNSQALYLKVNALEKIAIADRWSVEWREVLLSLSEVIAVDEPKHRIILTEKPAGASSGPTTLGSSTSMIPPGAEEIAPVEDSEASTSTVSTATASTATTSTPTKGNKEKLKEYKIKYTEPADVPIIIEKLKFYIHEAPVSLPRAKALSLLKAVGGALNPLNALNVLPLPFTGGDKKKKKTTAASNSGVASPGGAAASTDASPVSATTPEPAVASTTEASSPLKRSTSEKVTGEGSSAKKERRKSLMPAPELSASTDSTAVQPSSHDDSTTTPSKHGKREKLSKRSETIATSTLSPSSAEKDSSASSSKKEKEKEKRKSKALTTPVEESAESSSIAPAVKSPRKSKSGKIPNLDDASLTESTAAEETKSPRKKSSRALKEKVEPATDAEPAQEQPKAHDEPKKADHDESKQETREEGKEEAHEEAPSVPAPAASE